MFSILAFRQEGDVLHFTMVEPQGDVVEQHHAAVAHCVVPWIDEILLPYARERGPSLGTDEVVNCIRRQAIRDGIPFESVDWLGLVLLAEQRYYEAAASLAVSDSPDLQQRLSSARTLAHTLGTIYGQIAQAISATSASMSG